MSSLLEQLDQILESTELPLTIQAMLSKLDVTKEARASAEMYLIDKLNELREVHQTYQQIVAEIGYDVGAIKEALTEFTNNVTLIWICIQGDWIQANNIANAHLLLHGTPNQHAIARAYVCSAFLNPLSKYIDDDVMQSNLEFLASLLKRAKFENENNLN